MFQQKQTLSYVLILFCLIPALSLAAPLQVGVSKEAPFVITHKDDVYSGISISIWEAVAQKAKLNYEYQRFPNEMEIIKAYKAGKIDVIVAPLPVTYRLLQDLHFSRPYFINKIGILVPDEVSKSAWIIFKSMLTSSYTPVLLAFLGIMVLFAIVMDAVDHYQSRRGWADHSLYGILYALVGLLTSNYMYIYRPETKTKLFLCVIGIIISIIFITLLTATVTSSILISHTNLNLNVKSLSTGTDKHLAIERFSPMVHVLQQNNIHMTYVNTLDEGFELLKNKQVDGVSANYASIKYHFNNQLHEYGLQEIIVGTSELAFAVRDPKTLRKINAALTDLQDKNEIYGLCLKYLPPDDASLCLI